MKKLLDAMNCTGLFRRDIDDIDNGKVLTEKEVLKNMEIVLGK
jgi:hypothetical protein